MKPLSSFLKTNKTKQRNVKNIPKGADVVESKVSPLDVVALAVKIQQMPFFLYTLLCDWGNCVREEWVRKYILQI